MSRSENLGSLLQNDYSQNGRLNPETETQEYTVKNTGESLMEIVRRMTGSTDWRPVYKLNADIIGSNPNYLEPGMVILIPNAKVADYDSLFI